MVTVTERLATTGPHFSLEFMPPRDDAEEAVLWGAVRRLERRGPAFVAVTYGAGGSRRDRTIRVTERIARQTTMLPVAHLTAVGHTVAELRQVIGSYAAAGVSNVLALRGDPPGRDPMAPWVLTRGGIDYADQLVGLIKSLGNFCVGVAAYSGRHPRSPDLATDTRYLKRKIDAGADYVITQMLFRPEDYLALRDRLAAAGADVPVIPGIMPVTSLSRLARICELSAQPVPAELAERLAAVTGDAAAGRQIGVEHATALGRRLLTEGVPSLHFFTYNRSRATLEVLAELGLDRAATATPAARTSAVAQPVPSLRLAPDEPAVSGAGIG